MTNMRYALPPITIYLRILVIWSLNAKIHCTEALPPPVIELPVVKLLPLFSLAMLGPPGSLLTITSPAVSRLELSPAAVLSLVWSLEGACELPPDAWEALLPPSSTPPETHTGFYSHAAFLLRHRNRETNTLQQTASDTRCFFTQTTCKHTNSNSITKHGDAFNVGFCFIHTAKTRISVLINTYTCYSFHLNYLLFEAKQAGWLLRERTTSLETNFPAQLCVDGQMKFVDDEVFINSSYDRLYV